MTTPSHLEFEDLAVTHRDRVYRQMLRLCGNREDAEDVLIDALLAAYRGMDSLREKAAFGAWLAQIARRLCFHLRSQTRIHEAVSLEVLETQGMEPASVAAEGPEELLATKELRAAVQGAIRELPEELREVYVLRDMEERSGEDTAARLGISLAAMKSRLHRARKQVRTRMDAIFAHPSNLNARKKR